MRFGGGVRVGEGARIEEIKYTLAHEEGNHRYAYEEDVSYLLERVEELEQSNEKLRGMVERAEKGRFNWMNRYHEEKGEPFLEYIDGERPG
jgi:hypothetical protein